MTKICLLFLIFSLSISACSFNQDVPNSGADFLQGNWADSVLNKERLVTYEQYALKFTCDSFYLKITSFSRTNLQDGRCYDNNRWNEYVKGTYSVNADTLNLNGSFVNQDFKYKPEGSCYRTGKFIQKFEINKISEDTIKLTNTIIPIPHLLILKEKLSCNLNPE